MTLFQFSIFDILNTFPLVVLITMFIVFFKYQFHVFVDIYKKSI